MLYALVIAAADPGPSTVTAPAGAPALVSYVAFAASVVAALGVGIPAVSKVLQSWGSRSQHAAQKDHVVAQTGQVTAGITLQGWQESRQEVRDARAEAKTARERADRAEERADDAERRADSAERAQHQTDLRVDALEDTIAALHRRIATCTVPTPPGCPLNAIGA